ncbi:MAG: sigma-70 family RNA polymerase sigma factor [Chloroflexi bacterium]|nr:sigma-70 family RNA polymerase sigma factor [Chloroflexota bacterium]
MERSLVERAQAGDRDAFEMLVRQKVDAVYRTAYAILGSEADAQDATQETFIAAWRSLPRLREPDRFPAWLGRITTNACRMSLRHRRSVREIPMDVDDRGAGASYEPPDGSIVDAQAFDRAFERLAVEQRSLLVAHHLEGRPLTDIALELAVPVGTVKSRLHTARAALERSLRAER